MVTSKRRSLRRAAAMLATAVLFGVAGCGNDAVAVSAADVDTPKASSLGAGWDRVAGFDELGAVVSPCGLPVLDDGVAGHGAGFVHSNGVNLMWAAVDETATGVRDLVDAAAEACATRGAGAAEKLEVWGPFAGAHNMPFIYGDGERVVFGTVPVDEDTTVLVRVTAPVLDAGQARALADAVADWASAELDGGASPVPADELAAAPGDGNDAPPVLEGFDPDQAGNSTF